MKYDYKKILPIRFHNVSYENDVLEVIKKESQKQLKQRDGLYLWGLPGSGKTHIACAIAKNILDFGLEVRFFNTSDFLERLRDEYDNKTKIDEDSNGLFRDTMDFRGILIFDDLGAEKASEWVIERLYMIINKKYEDMIPIIFTSNCDLEILSARLGDRITSRIAGMASFIHVNGPDRRLSDVNKI